MSVSKVVLAGVQIDNLDETSVVNHVFNEQAAGRGGRIVTPNVDYLRQIYADIDLQSLVSGADLVVADGMPLIWASRILKTPLAERVTGAQLIWSLSGAAADRNVPVFLMGGAAGVAERAGVALTNRYPRLKLVGTHCPRPGFEDDSEQMREIVSRIEQTSPGVIFFALGFPKQEPMHGWLDAEPVWPWRRVTYGVLPSGYSQWALNGFVASSKSPGGSSLDTSSTTYRSRFS
jgi:N-acetylglucosaminyldiphosphoundecaprenol N-acetyl-beta-D-mannosaminyltransferase